MNKHPNIILIVVDALRAKNLSCYGYNKLTSPNIDNLVKNSILFENAYSCATTTYPSLTSIFSGKYPLSHGIIKHNRSLTSTDIDALNNSGTIFLPEILKHQGYTTLAVDWMGRWLKRGYDYYSGILSPFTTKLYSVLKYLFKSEELASRIAHPKLIDHAENVTKRSINLIKKYEKEKFFLFIHYWDTHIPYNPPERYYKKFVNDDYGINYDVEDIVNKFNPAYYKKYFEQTYRIPSNVIKINELFARYDGSISYIDHQLSRLFKTLESLEISDETMIILTSDHGESLTEHGIYFGHHGLYDATVHVPLIMSYSALPKNKRIKSFVQHIDITPTILDILKINANNLYLDGESLLPLIDDKITEIRKSIYVEEADVEQKRAIRTYKHKYITALSEKDAYCQACGVIHGGVEELYDLQNDPEETNNIIINNPEVSDILKNELSNLIKNIEDKKEKNQLMLIHKKGDSVPREEKIIEERLRALGYIS
jgi:arylsulfatase A-like enzyme